MKTRFIKSAEMLKDCPDTGLPEVGIVGRSNAGKSTLVNKLLKQKLARVSGKPGHTTLLNFFEVDGRFVLVDMPGYGYATRSEDQRLKWAPMIEAFLADRQPLAGLILVMDAAREWSVQEEDLVAWLSQRDLPVILAVNKVDKLNQKELSAKKKELSALQGLAAVHYISAGKGRGIEEINRSVFDNILRK